MDIMHLSIAAARVNAGLTQKDAAKRLGITAKALQGWECGKTPLKRYHAIALAAIYDCPVDSIFFGSNTN